MKKGSKKKAIAAAVSALILAIIGLLEATGVDPVELEGVETSLMAIPGAIETEIDEDTDTDVTPIQGISVQGIGQAPKLKGR